MQVPQPWPIEDLTGELDRYQSEDQPAPEEAALVYDFLFNKLQQNPLGFPRAFHDATDEPEYSVTVPGTDVVVSYVVYRPNVVTPATTAAERRVVLTDVRRRSDPRP